MRDHRRRPFPSLLTAAAAVAGRGLALASSATALVRRSKPLHPVGVVSRGILTVAPAAGRTGSPLLDEPGAHDCVVRASWAAGTGPEHVDIEGFALRVLGVGADDAHCDLLFASTGVGRWTRHLLAPRRPGRHGAQTTLLPVRAGGRPLLVRLDPVDAGTQPWPTQYVLSWAREREGWQRFGSLAVTWHDHDDAPERFDPVANPLPGTSQYAAVARLREPAYRSARLARPSAGRLPRT
jgi:hypothetical protein